MHDHHCTWHITKRSTLIIWQHKYIISKNDPIFISQRIERNVSSRSLTATSHSNGNGQNLTPQNTNPSTDYDKTLQNRLCPWNKLVTQIWYKSAVRERLAKYVKYKASSFYFYLYIFSMASEVTSVPILTHNGSNYAESRKDVPFGGPHDGRRHSGVNFPKNPLKGGVVRQSQPSWWKMKISISSKLCNLFEWNFNTLMTIPIFNMDSLKWRHYNSKMRAGAILDFWKIAITLPRIECHITKIQDVGGCHFRFHQSVISTPWMGALHSHQIWWAGAEWRPVVDDMAKHHFYKNKIAPATILGFAKIAITSPKIKGFGSYFVYRYTKHLKLDHVTKNAI